MATGRDDEERTTVIDVPEVVGVFDGFDTSQAAFYDLRMVGFGRHDISLLGDEAAMEEKLGRAYWRSKELADDPRTPRAAFASKEAIGELEGAVDGGFFFLGSYIAMAAMLTPASTLAASIAAIAVGGSPGAVLGTLLARRIGRHHKDYYAHQIGHGGILPWVRIVDEEREKLAVEITKGHSGRDVHVHGWSA